MAHCDRVFKINFFFVQSWKAKNFVLKLLSKQLKESYLMQLKLMSPIRLMGLSTDGHVDGRDAKKRVWRWAKN